MLEVSVHLVNGTGDKLVGLVAGCFIIQKSLSSVGVNNGQCISKQAKEGKFVGAVDIGIQPCQVSIHLEML